MERHYIEFVDSTLVQRGRYALVSLMVKKRVTHVLRDSCKTTWQGTGYINGLVVH